MTPQEVNKKAAHDSFKKHLFDIGQEKVYKAIVIEISCEGWGCALEWATIEAPCVDLGYFRLMRRAFEYIANNNQEPEIQEILLGDDPF